MTLKEYFEIFDRKDFTYQEKVKMPKCSLVCLFAFGQYTNYDHYCSNNICKNRSIRWSILVSLGMYGNKIIKSSPLSLSSSNSLKSQSLYMTIYIRLS